MLSTLGELELPAACRQLHCPSPPLSHLSSPLAALLPASPLLSLLSVLWGPLASLLSSSGTRLYPSHSFPLEREKSRFFSRKRKTQIPLNKLRNHEAGYKYRLTKQISATLCLSGNAAQCLWRVQCPSTELCSPWEPPFPLPAQLPHVLQLHPVGLHLVIMAACLTGRQGSAADGQSEELDGM